MIKPALWYFVNENNLLKSGRHKKGQGIAPQQARIASGKERSKKSTKKRGEAAASPLISSEYVAVSGDPPRGAANEGKD